MATQTRSVVVLLQKVRRTRLLIGQRPLAHHGDSLVRRRHEFRYNVQMFGAFVGAFAPPPPPPTTPPPPTLNDIHHGVWLAPP